MALAQCCIESSVASFEDFTCERCSKSSSSCPSSSTCSPDFSFDNPCFADSSSSSRGCDSSENYPSSGYYGESCSSSSSSSICNPCEPIKPINAYLNSTRNCEKALRLIDWQPAFPAFQYFFDVQREVQAAFDNLDALTLPGNLNAIQTEYGVSIYYTADINDEFLVATDGTTVSAFSTVCMPLDRAYALNKGTYAVMTVEGTTYSTYGFTILYDTATYGVLITMTRQSIPKRQIRMKRHRFLPNGL